MKSVATAEAPSAAELAETLSAIRTEIDELTESIQQAEAHATKASNDEAAYHKAESRVRDLQRQISKKRQRSERLQGAHGEAVSRELDAEIERLQKEDRRLCGELNAFGEKTVRQKEAEEQRHKEAMAKLDDALEEARYRHDSTRRLLGDALHKKSAANADEIAHLLLMRDEVREKAAAVRKELEGAELAYRSLDREYNQAVRDGADKHNLEVYRERADHKKDHIEVVRQREQKIDGDLARLGARLQDLGGDPACK